MSDVEAVDGDGYMADTTFLEAAAAAVASVRTDHAGTGDRLLPAASMYYSDAHC